MSGHDKEEPALRKQLDRMSRDATVDVLVHPAGPLEGLVAYLTARQDAGDLRFNVLGLAGCVVLRGSPDVIREVSERDDVRLVTEHPTFRADDAASHPEGGAC